MSNTYELTEEKNLIPATEGITGLYIGDLLPQIKFNVIIPSKLTFSDIFVNTTEVSVTSTPYILPELEEYNSPSVLYILNNTESKKDILVRSPTYASDKKYMCCFLPYPTISSGETAHLEITEEYWHTNYNYVSPFDPDYCYETFDSFGGYGWYIKLP